MEPPIWKCLARYIFCAFLMLMMYGAVWLDAQGGDTPRAPMDENGNLLPETPERHLARLQEVGKFNEGGVVESLELSILLLIICTSGWMAYRHPEVRAISLLFCGGLGVLAIREQDYWFDQFHHGFWAIPAGLLIAVMLVYAWKKRRELQPELREFLQTPGWGLFLAGGLMIMVFARLMGQKAL